MMMFVSMNALAGIGFIPAKFEAARIYFAAAEKRFDFPRCSRCRGIIRTALLDFEKLDEIKHFRLLFQGKGICFSCNDVGEFHVNPLLPAWAN